MQIAQLLNPDRVAIDVQVGSKKRALEALSTLLAHDQEGITATEIFDSLISRERLGSTGLGHGVALPHGRVSGTDQTLGAFIRLEEGIDFDAIDDQPVDLLFGLLVPEEATDEHLRLLATLAENFSDPQLRRALREAESGDRLIALLTRRETP